MAAARGCRMCLRTVRQRNGAFLLEKPFQIRTRPITQKCLLLPISSRQYASASAVEQPPGSAHDEPSQSPSIPSRTSKRMDTEAPAFSEHHGVLASTEIMFKECAAQADYYVPQAFQNTEIPKNAAGEDLGEGTGWWYESLGLPPTFSSWAQVTFLHVYLLTVRLRYFPPAHAQQWQQHLHDHMFYECEHRMNIFHGLTSRTIRNKYLKELYNQWRGVIGAYDEGLIKGDAVLAAAVWRNIFKADEDVDWRNVALVVGFMRRGLRALDRAHDKTLITGMIKFGSPMSEMAVVEKESLGIKEPFSKLDEQAGAVAPKSDVK